MMTEVEIFERKAQLHEQAAELFRQDALRHEMEARRLRKAASLLRGTDEKKISRKQ